MKLLASIALALIFSGLLLAQDPQLQFTHKGSVFHVKFSPSATKLLSYSSGNQELAAWDVPTGSLFWKRSISFIAKSDEYYTLDSFAWSSDEKLIATGSANGTIQLWNAGDGRFLWRADVGSGGVSAVAFSPDGQTLAATGDGTDGSTARVFDVRTGEEVKSFTDNMCRAAGIAFDLSGKLLKIGNLNGSVVRWDLQSGKPLDTADCKDKYAYARERTFSDDLTISVRRASTENVVFEDANGSVIKDTPLANSQLRAVVNSRVRKAVVQSYGGHRLFDLSTGDEQIIPDCSGSAFDLSADGKLFAQACDAFKTSIKITDLASGSSRTLDGHPSMVHAVVYSPVFSVLALAGNDGNAYLLDPATRSVKKVLHGNGERLTSLAFTSDGKHLLTGGEDTLLRRWDLVTAATVKETKLVEDSVAEIKRLEISPGGKYILATVGATVLLLDETMNVRGSLRTPEGYSDTGGNMTFTYSSVPVNAAVFSASGRQVITAHPDGTIRIWDTATLRQMKKFKIADSVDFVATIDNMRLVAVAADGKKHRFVIVDQASGMRLRQSVALEDSYLEKMFLSADKSLAVVTSNMGDAVFCDLRTMALRTLDDHLSGYDSVAFSRDGKTFFMGGEDQNLSLYDTRTLKRQWRLLPDFVPDEAERQLSEERSRRIAEVMRKTEQRNRDAAAYVKINRKNVYVTFEHYGNMSNPAEKHLVEGNSLKESKDAKPMTESNAVWLRLHNDASLPISVPTESMYLPDPKCFYQFPNGEKLHGLCPDREIGIWFGLKDMKGKWVPYGYDFGSSAVLLPGSSVIFPVPLAIWNKQYSAVFNYSFQNVKASQNDHDMKYGDEVEMRVNKESLRRR